MHVEAMARKLIGFDPETLQALERLSSDSSKSVQQLADCRPPRISSLGALKPVLSLLSANGTRFGYRNIILWRGFRGFPKARAIFGSVYRQTNPQSHLERDSSSLLNLSF